MDPVQRSVVFGQNALPAPVPAAPCRRTRQGDHHRIPGASRAASSAGATTCAVTPRGARAEAERGGKICAVGRDDTAPDRRVRQGRIQGFASNSRRETGHCSRPRSPGGPRRRSAPMVVASRHEPVRRRHRRGSPPSSGARRRRRPPTRRRAPVRGTPRMSLPTGGHQADRVLGGGHRVRDSPPVARPTRTLCARRCAAPAPPSPCGWRRWKMALTTTPGGACRQLPCQCRHRAFRAAMGTGVGRATRSRRDAEDMAVTGPRPSAAGAAVSTFRVTVGCTDRIAPVVVRGPSRNWVGPRDAGDVDHGVRSAGIRRRGR